MPLTELRRAFTPFFVFLTFTVCVNPCVASASNTAPVLSASPPTTVAVGSRYYFKPTARDADGDTLRFSIANKPDWLNYSSSTGALSGTPTKSSIGVFPGIKIWVTDGRASRSLHGYAITVTTSTTSTSSNAAPKISGTPPPTGVVNQSYSFTPIASDPNGDTLRFTIKNKPGWAGFNSSTGRLSGTPSSSSVGTFSTIEITVSDGKVSSALPAFTIKCDQRRGGRHRNVVLGRTDAQHGRHPAHRTSRAIASITGRRPGNIRERFRCRVPSLTTVAVEGLASGTWYFAVKSVANDGQESTFSEPVSKAIP
jgi:phenylpyruvate tautomerase PptA (4-oxalocrotonate tautomerase family)